MRTAPGTEQRTVASPLPAEMGLRILEREWQGESERERETGGPEEGAAHGCQAVADVDGPEGERA
jgi:hypothetical protein